jgi:AcrR family transcriptional regulator
MATQGATYDEIIDAGIEAVSLYGLAKLSMSDVASRAGISRPTLYKHFGSRDELVAAAVQREAESLVVSVLRAADGHESPAESLEAAIAAALQLTREHPLLDRIIRTEPESLLPYLTTDRIGGDGGTGGAAVLLFVRTATEALVRDRLALDELTSRRLADMIARLLVSYSISAPDDPPEVVAASVSGILLDGALTTSATNDQVPSASAEGEPR